jgi:hypothetical protein
VRIRSEIRLNAKVYPRLWGSFETVSFAQKQPASDAAPGQHQALPIKHGGDGISLRYGGNANADLARAL